jgi:hypothetical protein
LETGCDVRLTVLFAGSLEEIGDKTEVLELGISAIFELAFFFLEEVQPISNKLFICTILLGYKQNENRTVFSFLS